MSKNNLSIRTISIIICIFAAANLAWTQEGNQDSTRSITSVDFQKQRSKNGQASAGSSSSGVKQPFGKSQNKKIAVITNSKRRYKLVKKTPSKVNQIGGGKPDIVKKTSNAEVKNEELGVTFWRLRPPGADEDDAPTFPVKINNKTENWTAERVSSTTQFKRGDRVRFTIESSRTGFLYIINREFYADGSTGEASLIFPTLRTRGGDNQVKAGSLVEIPASTDSVPYFTITPGRADYTGEEVLVIISSAKIPGIETEKRAQKITPEKIQKWMADWSADIEVYDAADGEGIAMTATEAEASTVSTRSLTQEEPLPQTIYRVRDKSQSAASRVVSNVGKDTLNLKQFTKMLHF